MSPITASPTTEYLDPAARRALVNRLARIEGHVRAIARMVEERACADEIMLQVAAVKGGLTRVAAKMVEEELAACVETCMRASPGLRAGPGEMDDRMDRLTRVLAGLLRS